MKEIMKKFNETKLYKVLESSWLCLRFPFLYPRNRFTGRHHTAVLHKPIFNAYKKGFTNINVTGKLLKDKKVDTITYFSFITKDGVSIYIDKENKKLVISNAIETKELNLMYLTWDGKFDIVSMSVNENNLVTVYLMAKDETDKTNYGFHFEKVELVINKFYKYLYNALFWLDNEVLDRILFIPTYTELDRMPEGWKKAFGIQMCKDIKAQLKKEHYLYKYRITDIKEKFGTLRWYDFEHSVAVGDIITIYEHISRNTCIVCGKPATKISAGYICPYCDEHYDTRYTVWQEKENDEWKETEEYKLLMEEIEKL